MLAKRFSLLVLTAFCSVSATPALDETRKALVIGNANYEATQPCAKLIGF